MLAIIRKFFKDNKGNTIVEVAIMLPILLGFFMGLVFFITAYRTQTIMNMAVKEGARTYAICQDDVMAKEKTKEELKLGYVKDADVVVDGNKVMISKSIGFYLPVFNKYIFELQANSEFFEEIETEHYGEFWDDYAVY